MIQTAQYLDGDISRIIEMAWEDRTPFEAISREYGLNESAVIRLMRGFIYKPIALSFGGRE